MCGALASTYVLVLAGSGDDYGGQPLVSLESLPVSSALKGKCSVSAAPAA